MRIEVTHQASDFNALNLVRGPVLSPLVFYQAKQGSPGQGPLSRFSAGRNTRNGCKKMGSTASLYFVLDKRTFRKSVGAAITRRTRSRKLGPCAVAMLPAAAGFHGALWFRQAAPSLRRR